MELFRGGPKGLRVIQTYLEKLELKKVYILVWIMILRCDASGCVLSHWTSLYRIYRLVGMIGQDPQELG